jgi:hypothetical protein
MISSVLYFARSSMTVVAACALYVSCVAMMYLFRLPDYVVGLLVLG